MPSEVLSTYACRQSSQETILSIASTEDASLRKVAFVSFTTNSVSNVLVLTTYRNSSLYSRRKAEIHKCLEAFHDLHSKTQPSTISESLLQLNIEFSG